MNDDLIKKKAKRAAYVVGISTFLGFSAMMFTPEIYFNSWTSLFILIYAGTASVGALGAYLSGKAAYFIFKHFITSKIGYIVILFLAAIISLPLGFFLEAFTIQRLARTPPYENKIDTNADGKIDKWIYDNDDKLSTIVEIDTDYDGKPDIREYYKNGKLIKREKY